MVFAIKKDAARGSAKAIRMGHPGWDLVPLISGIGKTPRTPPPDGRFVAELVLLRVITRDLTLGSHDARMFALAAVQSAPRERIARYTGYLKALAPPSVRQPLETLMKTVFKDAFVDGLLNQGRAEGGAETARKLLLQLLGKRFTVPDDIRRRIETCTDTPKMDTWFDRAITATSLDEVFAELRARRSLRSGFHPRPPSPGARRLTAGGGRRLRGGRGGWRRPRRRRSRCAG